MEINYQESRWRCTNAFRLSSSTTPNRYGSWSYCLGNMEGAVAGVHNVLYIGYYLGTADAGCIFVVKQAIRIRVAQRDRKPKLCIPDIRSSVSLRKMHKRH